MFDGKKEHKPGSMLTPAGGLSHFSGRFGLVCDNVLEYEVVLASGAVLIITENDGKHQDLLRALRGGSNNFGIVTRFTFRTFHQGHVWGGNIIHGLETKDQQLSTFYNYASSSKFDPSASLIQSCAMSGDRGSGIVNGIVCTAPETKPPSVQPFTRLEPIYINTLRELSLTELTLEQDAFNEYGLW